MRRYGRWVGNPEGVAENTEFCVADVWHGVATGDTQCARKRGHGPGGLYCQQHARMFEKGGCVYVPMDREGKQ
jgi:hypothetical protein